MAFEGLSQKLQEVFKKLSSKGRLNEADVKAAMREVRLALLEADVNYMVVRDFIKTVTERAVGAEILQSLTPGQQVIKIVNEELTALMGSTNSKINFSPNPPTIIMLIGLQGAGKTTMAGKLAGWLKQQGKKPLLAAADIYRPAAIQQLQVVGEKFEVPVFEMGQTDPVEIAKNAKNHAMRYLNDVVIIDTAGRLHIDEELMGELKRMETAVRPNEILLTVDAMTGQDAVNVAEAFSKQLGITGVILTKLDGDTRGGAAISVKAVTGKPIKFAGIGEQLTVNNIEPFHPDRMASRILGMGDVLTLIEKAQSAFDDKSAAELEKKIRSSQFTLDDFLDQFTQMKKMGGISELLGMIPGAQAIREEDIDQRQMGRVEAIIRSMTPAERRNPGLLNAGRKKRVAAGSGTSVQQVNQLLKQFDQARAMMKQMTGMGRGKRGKRARNLPRNFFN
ncbi:MAG: signal recognition particle protein [Christensenellales bacterium]